MSDPPLVWDDLQYFLAVARSGQLSRAARRLSTSHVTVGRRIDRLEAALQTRLFERGPRGYELTPNGERLVASAERMERESERLQEEVAGHGSPHRGVIRLNAPEGFADFFCRTILPEFAAAFPGLSLEFVAIQQILALARKRGDIAILLDPPRAGPYRVEKLADYSLHLYASRGYLERRPAPARREDLIHHPFIGYIEEMVFAPGLDYLGDVHPGIRPRFQFSSIFSQLTATRQGLGLCVLPHFIARRHEDLRPVLPGEVRLGRSYWVSCHQDLREAPRERAVIEMLLAAVRARAGELLPEEPLPEAPPGDQSASESSLSTRAPSAPRGWESPASSR